MQWNGFTPVPDNDDDFARRKPKEDPAITAMKKLWDAQTYIRRVYMSDRCPTPPAPLYDENGVYHSPDMPEPYRSLYDACEILLDARMKIKRGYKGKLW